MAKRYVIKHPTLGYFTQFVTSETKPILAPMDLKLHGNSPPVPKGSVIGHEEHKKPEFAAYLPAATKYGDAASAQEHIDGKLPDFHGGAEAFAGCTVEEIEI